MSAKFKAWLRVSPAPTTLHESSAIYKKLKSQGQIQGFARTPQLKTTYQPSETASSTTVDTTDDKASTSFCATFAHEPLHLQKSFDVTVYHDVIDPKESDPYNIRGLQYRKPYPPPKTFSCVVERTEAECQGLGNVNPWRGRFSTQKDHWLETVYKETGAPPGTMAGLAAEEKSYDESATLKRNLVKERNKKGIRMNSLMEVWHEAVKQHEATKQQGGLKQHSNSETIKQKRPKLRTSSTTQEDDVL